MNSSFVTVISNDDKLLQIEHERNIVYKSTHNLNCEYHEIHKALNQTHFSALTFHGQTDSKEHIE